MAGEKLPVKRAYDFALLRRCGAQAQAVREMGFPNRGKVSTTALRRGLMLRLFRDKGLLNDFIASDWKYGSTAAGRRSIERHLRLLDERGL